MYTDIDENPTTKSMMGKKTTRPEEINACYERAKRTIKSSTTTTMSEKLVLNDTVYPYWIGDSNCFWYIRGKKEGQEYRLVSADKALNSVAFDHKALAIELEKATGQSVDPHNLPLEKIKFDLNQQKISIFAFKEYWWFDISGNKLTKKRASPQEAIDKHWLLSPNGKRAVFVRNYNIWVHELDTGKERALTQDGEEFFVYGVSEGIWGYTPLRAIQASWSPNSKYIFSLQRDTRKVRKFPVLHAIPDDGSIAPQVEYQRIALPGDEHVEELRLVIINVDEGNCVEVDYRRIPSIRNHLGFFNKKMGWWSNDSNRVWFLDMERGDTAVRLIEANIQTGETKQLFEEVSETHIDLTMNSDTLPSFIPLPETNELLWLSERTGWAHFYLYDLNTGTLKNAVTKGDGWLVRNSLRYDAQRRDFFVLAAGREPNRDPYYRTLLRVNIDNGDIAELTSGNYDFQVMSKDTPTGSFYKTDPETIGVSPTGDYVVVTRSRVDQTPVTYLLDRNGKHLLELETADISALHEGWNWPEPVEMKAADGETNIYGVIYRPSNYSPNKKYPVIDACFASMEFGPVPKGSFANSDFEGIFFYQAAALAELGFIVVQIAGRGTGYRGKEFHDHSYGWVERASDLADHMSGLKQLGNCYREMDMERVGIVSVDGGAGGVQGLLWYPDFYKVGVANDPHDSRLLPATPWGDKYEGINGSQPERNFSIEEKFPENYAANLRGKLMLILSMRRRGHSIAMLRIADALQKANKDFDLIFNSGAYSQPYHTRRAWDFLVKNLQNIEPPETFNLN